MSEEELYKLLNIPNKPWIELTDEEIQLFEKNNNYIKQLQQENENLRSTIKNDDVAVNNLCKEFENVSNKLIDYKSAWNELKNKTNEELKQATWAGAGLNDTKISMQELEQKYKIGGE